MLSRRTALIAGALAIGALACSDSSEVSDDGGTADASIPPDASGPFDGGPGRDLGSEPDLGSCEDDPCLCESTGGTWDETSCGDYVCGMPPLCDAIIPGCDCGAGETFVDGTGCAPDASCTCDTDECLCESTGGTWDETACGDYMCGVPNDCRAVIPGCDCGFGQNFVDGSGCAADDGCTCDSDECLCESTGGTWDETACGDYTCGVPNSCEAIIPGCDCGSGANFGDEGCATDPSC